MCSYTCYWNNEWIYIFLLKMADFECRQLEIGIEFVCWSFAECNNFSEGSSEPEKGPQVIRVQGQQPMNFWTRITCWYIVPLNAWVDWKFQFYHEWELLSAATCWCKDMDCAKYIRKLLLKFCWAGKVHMDAYVCTYTHTYVCSYVRMASLVCV